MPELPEVERAVVLIRSVGAGKIIEHVETNEDSIVYAGTTHEEFAKEIQGRTLLNAHRYGKVFYLELDGQGKVPVLHFGMTGMLQVRGEPPIFYKTTSKKSSDLWPPKSTKFVLHLIDTATKVKTELAFLDVRRLGRIRLCQSPLDEHPISELGFDPIFSMPPLKEFTALVMRRNCPIKALLLDQSFSAGVGNWVADEILYHARVHPEQRCKTLEEGQIKEVHRCTKYVCETAVAVNADSSKFPKDWLFEHRWGKGRQRKRHELLLSSGEPATINWLTVGGRTSAFVVELQILPAGTKIMDDSGSEQRHTTLNAGQKRRMRQHEIDEEHKEMVGVKGPFSGGITPRGKEMVKGKSELDVDNHGGGTRKRVRAGYSSLKETRNAEDEKSGTKSTTKSKAVEDTESELSDLPTTPSPNELKLVLDDKPGVKRKARSKVAKAEDIKDPVGQGSRGQRGRRARVNPKNS